MRVISDCACVVNDDEPSAWRTMGCFVHGKKIPEV